MKHAAVCAGRANCASLPSGILSKAYVRNEASHPSGFFEQHAQNGERLEFCRSDLVAKLISAGVQGCHATEDSPAGCSSDS
jgi:hypothetical protein